MSPMSGHRPSSRRGPTTPPRGLSAWIGELATASATMLDSALHLGSLQNVSTAGPVFRTPDAMKERGLLAPQLSQAFMLGVSTSSTTMGGPWWKRTTARRSWAWTCTGAGRCWSGWPRMARSSARRGSPTARRGWRPRSRAGLHPKVVLEACWLVLGGGHADGGRRRGAPGPSAGGEGLQPPPGQERRSGRPRPGRPAADGPGGGVDRPGGESASCGRSPGTAASWCRCAPAARTRSTGCWPSWASR